MFALLKVLSLIMLIVLLYDIDIPSDEQVAVSGVQGLLQNVLPAPVASSSVNKPSEPPNAPATRVRRYPQRDRKA